MHPYIKLAKQAVEYNFLNNTPKPEKSITPAMLKKKAGVFITIYNGKNLRGCIGTFASTKKNIGQEIIANAISAATTDYRFEPITTKELSKLSYEVSVLGEPEEIGSLNNLDPKKYGVIVQSGFRRGLLLPDLEGVETAEQQVSIAAQKGGIDLADDDVQLFRFITERYK